MGRCPRTHRRDRLRAARIRQNFRWTKRCCLRVLRAGDPPPRPRSKGSMVTSCDELGGIGNLSSTTDPCVIPPNTTTALTPGTWILGSGSLTMSPNASIGCDVPGCLFTVLLGGTLRVTERARIHGGYVNVTAAAVEIVGVDASIDADGSADPTERRGWRSGDENRRASTWDPHAGAGFGGEGASCPRSSSTLPSNPRRPGVRVLRFRRQRRREGRAAANLRDLRGGRMDRRR